MTVAGDQAELLLPAAREGDAESLDRLLELYRNYLKLLARAQLRASLQVRVDPSDLAQVTLIDAHRGFAQFRGQTEQELTAWLRKILVRKLADQVKRHRSQKRDVRREQSLEVVPQAIDPFLVGGNEGVGRGHHSDDDDGENQDVFRRSLSALASDPLNDAFQHFHTPWA